MRPLIVGQITGVSQFAAVVAPAVLRRPHRWPSSNQATTLESQTIHAIQHVSGRTLRDKVRPENGSAHRPESVRAARALQPFDLTWLEEPIIPEDVAGHARVLASGG